MNNFLISVILVAHNQEPFIATALQSLSLQTIGIEKLEIILINDASTDATNEVMAQFQAQHPNNVKLKSVNFRNVGKTRNAALDLVSTEFVMFLDGDDTLENNACEILLQTAQRTQSELVITPLYRLKNDLIKHKAKNIAKIETLTPTQLNIKLLQHSDFMGHVIGILFASKLFTKVRFPEFSCYEDVFIAPDIIAKINQAAWLSSYIYNYRCVANSVSSSLNNNKATYMFKVLEKLKPCNSNDTKLMRLYYQALCVKQCRILMDNVANLSSENRTILKKIIEQIPLIPFLLSRHIRFSRKRLLLQNRKEVFNWYE